MKFKNPLLAVKDIEKSKLFYRNVLGLRVTSDFGANVTLTGGVCLQTADTWRGFISVSESDMVFGSKTSEIYFEEDDFDAFIGHINTIDDIEYVHRAYEHSWGQRVVRFYDPDMHIIEVGESLSAVCRRFEKTGMSAEEIGGRMDIPVSTVRRLLK